MSITLQDMIERLSEEDIILGETEVLGTKYLLKAKGQTLYKLDLDDSKAYIEFYSKEIVLPITNFLKLFYESTSVTDAHKLINIWIRHEVVHAFLHESGVDGDDLNEENLCDFLSVNLNKMALAAGKICVNNDIYTNFVKELTEKAENFTPYY